MEIWKSILGFEGLYEVSNQGRVRNSKTSKVLKPFKSGGYVHLAVRLYRESKRRGRKVHRLVLETFVGPCPKEMEGSHLDNNPTNNRLSNLIWETRKENLGRSTKTGRYERSKETKRKISLAQKGNQYAKGSKRSEGTKREISLTLKGHKQSEETKRRRSESMKKYWAERR